MATEQTPPMENASISLSDHGHHRDAAHHDHRAGELQRTDAAQILEGLPRISGSEIRRFLEVGARRSKPCGRTPHSAWSKPDRWAIRRPRGQPHGTAQERPGHHAEGRSRVAGKRPRQGHQFMASTSTGVAGLVAGGDGQALRSRHHRVLQAGRGLLAATAMRALSASSPRASRRSSTRPQAWFWNRSPLATPHHPQQPRWPAFEDASKSGSSRSLGPSETPSSGRATLWASFGASGATWSSPSTGTRCAARWQAHHRSKKRAETDDGFKASPSATAAASRRNRNARELFVVNSACLLRLGLAFHEIDSTSLAVAYEPGGDDLGSLSPSACFGQPSSPMF